MAFPPIQIHGSLSKRLTAEEAEQSLSAFLKKSETNPYLHPDAMLSLTGVTWSAQSGPTGGLAIHHLKRIAAGLRGENLVLETAEDLAKLTGEQVLLAGDDIRHDASVAESSTERFGTPKRKRSTEDISQWAEESSEAAFGDKTKAGSDNADFQDKEEFELEQEIVEGQVGIRDATKGSQSMSKRAKSEEGLKETRKPLTTEEKALRKAEKKARRKEEKKLKKEKD